MGSKRKSILVWLAVMVSLVLAVSGCGEGNGLSDKFDEETVMEKAMVAVGYFNERDYQGIIDMGSEIMQASITAEQFQAASDPYLDKCGKFVEISKSVVLGNTDDQTGESYGGVVMVGKYESGQIQFTIAFDERMELVQFFIK